MTDDTLRTVRIERTAAGHYTATNARGGRITFDSGGDTGFTGIDAEGSDVEGGRHHARHADANQDLGREHMGEVAMAGRDGA